MTTQFAEGAEPTVVTPVPHMVVLDVGHGSAALIHENQSTLLVDAATRSHVLEYLRQNRIDTIDVVILSHSDKDHIGGLASLLTNGIRIGLIRVNADAAKDTETWRDLIFALEDARRGGDLRFEVGLSTGVIDIAGFQRCRAEVVTPTPGLAALGVGAQTREGRRITSNSISASVRIEFEGRPVALVSGDMDSVSLDDALAAGVDLHAAVLVFPHHGGLPGEDPATFVEKLMGAVRPQLVVISHGRSQHENPRPEIVDAVRKRGAYVACTQLSKRCAEHLPRTPAQHLSAHYAGGALAGACCAGSMVIDFISAQFSTRPAHQIFVSEIPSALCGQRLAI